MSEELMVNLGENSYTIQIENGLLSGLPDRVREFRRSDKVFIITDSVVDGIYGDMLLYNFLKNGFVPRRYVVSPGEESKNLAEVEKIYGAMLSFGISRNDLVIALGGGVVGDLGGFAAATFLRGIPFIQVPTTLLAQVDSSIGGKVAVNLPQGKNMAGVFYQPKAVYIDPSVLDTLPDRLFSDGMAEVIKYGCIKDDGFLSLLEALSGRENIMERIEEIIFRCCDIKRELVEADERDRGERMLLNFGHTLGHAVESLSGYGYSHGEAVAVGMSVISELGEFSGITAKGSSVRIRNLLGVYGLPYKLPDFDKERIEETILRDKKNLGAELNLVLLERPGKALIHKTGVNFFSKLGL